MNVVNIPAVNATAVEYAQELLKRCQSGEVVSVTAIEELPGGSYYIAGSSTSSRLRTMGMLMDAVIMRSMEGRE